MQHRGIGRMVREIEDGMSTISQVSPTNTIWINGSFDVLHAGHIELFKYAQSVGDRLVVGTDTDERIRELKGSTRPINKQNIVYPCYVLSATSMR